MPAAKSTSLRVLVIGSGAREHALARRLAQSPAVSAVHVAPGNPGMSEDAGVSVTGAWCTAGTVRDLAIDLAVIGPEEPLVRGLADELREAGCAVVGPEARAAALEGSKAAAREFMAQAGVRTPEWRVCSDLEEARAAIAGFGAPVVIKADGLASGKGVAVCASETQARAAAETILRDRLYGDAGSRVVVERAVVGRETSVLALLDESGYFMLPPTRDYYEIGPLSERSTTGGMGAVAPDPEVDVAMRERIERELLEPTAALIRSKGWTYRGFLYIGVVIDAEGPLALEYNVRAGDPELQATLELVEGDLGLLLAGLAGGRLTDTLKPAGIQQREGAACALVASAGGYPQLPSSGDRLTLEPVPAGSELAGTTAVHFAGVGRGSADGELMTARGRVLSVVGVGADLDTARVRAYRRMQLVRFDGMQVRADVGGAPLGGALIEESDVLMLQFAKRGGLLPVVVQDSATREVLMLGYANRRAVEETRRRGYATFWSTSRNALWTKGESSGDWLRLDAIRVDCDQDALLYEVTPEGNGTCHTVSRDGSPRRRCFYRRLDAEGLLVNEIP